VRTEGSSNNIVELSVIRRSRHRASSPYGPVRAGLTTSQITQDQQLTELLSSLEREVATLVSKSCTVLDTLNTVTQEVSAVLSSIAIDEAGTNE
jgi:hypothetical protein